LEFINKYTTEGSDLKKKLLIAKDSVFFDWFFDWLRLDVVDAKEAKLSRFKEHTETMKKRVAFDSAKRTAQFAAIQDDIAMLFDSSSSKSSSDSDKTEAQKQHRARQENANKTRRRPRERRPRNSQEKSKQIRSATKQKKTLSKLRSPTELKIMVSCR